MTNDQLNKGKGGRERLGRRRILSVLLQIEDDTEATRRDSRRRQ